MSGIEPVKAKMKIFLGYFKVIELRSGNVTINLGGNVHVTMYILGLPVTLKHGDEIPLFTELPYDTEPFNALLGQPSK